MPPRVEGNAFSIVKEIIEGFLCDYPAEVVSRWTQKYGPAVAFPALTQDALVTIVPEHIKAILSTQFEIFDKGPISLSQVKSILGTGIFNADGELWKFHRSITRSFFSRERISDFDIYDKTFSEALVHAKNHISGGCSIDVQDWTARYTLDAATEFLCGKSVNSLSAGLAYPKSSGKPDSGVFENHASSKFVNAFSRALADAAMRVGRGPDWPLFEFFKDIIVPSREVIDDFVFPLMERALKNAEKSSKLGDDDEPQTLLDYLVTQTQDRTIIQDEVINLLVAGRDTTGCLLSFSIYMLAEHPHIEKRLREEIFSIVGPTDRPSFDNIKSLKYLRAFINEILRLYPPVPQNNRTPNKDVVIPGTASGIEPIYIRKRTKCAYNVLYMQRRTDLWGPDALEFDPDRFLDYRLRKYLTHNPFIFIPFHAGPRICLGQQFAYHEASYFLVKLLQSFTNFRLDEQQNLPPPDTWKTRRGRQAAEKIYLSTGMTLYSKGGLWFKMDEYQPS